MSIRKPIEAMSADDIFDVISSWIGKANAIVDCLGNLDLDGGSLSDGSLNFASWAAKDLLKEALKYSRTLLDAAKQAERGGSHERIR